MIDRFSRAALACVLALSLACGGGDAGSDEAAPPVEADAGAQDASGSESPPAPGTSAGDAATSTPVTAPEIEAWERGMAAELEAVRAAGARMKEAKSGEDTLSAMMAVQETSTQEAGARASGLDLERYKFVRSELSAAVSYLTPHLGGIDTTMLSPAQRDELRQSNEAQLKQMEERVPAQVVEALRPRAPELRKRSLELAGERLKSAGM